MITRDAVANAYKSTGLRPVIVPYYDAERGIASPLGVLCVANGVPIVQLHEYFGAEFVTDFNHGMNNNPSSLARDPDAYSQGFEFRTMVLSGEFAQPAAV